MKQIAIRKMNQTDLALLQEISIETFSDTFRDDNTAKDLQDYIDRAYNEAQLQKELDCQASFFFLVTVEEQPAGYLKLNVEEAQSEAMGTQALEIERIYVRRAFKRMGIGTSLLALAQAEAKRLGKQSIWLGVWEDNQKALAFYHENGFRYHSQHSFFVGDDEQTDLILIKTLEEQQDDKNNG